MRSRLLLPMLFLSAGSTLLTASCAAARPATPMGPKQAWEARIRAIPPSWGPKELEEFLAALREPPLHGPELGTATIPLERPPQVWCSHYALDGTFSLYVVWNERDPMKGIRSVEVVGLPDLRHRIDPDLFDAVSAIHRSPSAERGLEFSSLRLIRAVNALQPLGRDQALKALWEYYGLARSLPFVELRKYSLDEARILPIVQLLFEAPPTGMPAFALGAPDVPAPPGDAWPLFPIALVQDVPFTVVSGYMLLGSPSDAAVHLRTKLGPLRTAPLAPRVGPMEAADELTQSAAWAALKLGPGNEGRKRWQVRRQALAAAASVFALRPEERSNDCCVDPTETQWRAAVERSRSAGIVWSPEVQDFILGR